VVDEISFFFYFFPSYCHNVCACSQYNVLLNLYQISNIRKSDCKDFLEKEYESRKTQKATPKQEWAYLNFIQRCSKEHPEFSKVQIVRAWKLERNSYVQKAKMILGKLSD